MRYAEVVRRSVDEAVDRAARFERIAEKRWKGLEHPAREHAARVLAVAEEADTLLRSGKEQEAFAVLLRSGYLVPLVP